MADARPTKRSDRIRDKSASVFTEKASFYEAVQYALYILKDDHVECT